MPHFCRCGGRLILLTPQNRFYFRARCNKCGIRYKQRKRQAAVHKL